MNIAIALPLLTVGIIMVGAGGFGWLCAVTAARADKRDAERREDREIDEWLEAMWKS